MAGSYAGFPRSDLRRSRECNAPPELIIGALPSFQVGRYVQAGAVALGGTEYDSFFEYAEEVAELNAANESVQVGEYSFFASILSARQSQRLVVSNGASNTSPRRAPQEARGARKRVASTVRAGLSFDEERAADRLAIHQAAVFIDDEGNEVDPYAELHGALTGEPNEDMNRHRNWGPKIVQLGMQPVKLDEGYSLGFPVLMDPDYRSSVDETYDAIRMAGYKRGLNSVLGTEQHAVRVLSLTEPFDDIKGDIILPRPPTHVLLGEITIETV